MKTQDEGWEQVMERTLHMCQLMGYTRDMTVKALEAADIRYRHPEECKELDARHEANIMEWKGIVAKRESDARIMEHNRLEAEAKARYWGCPCKARVISNFQSQFGYTNEWYD